MTSPKNISDYQAVLDGVFPASARRGRSCGELKIQAIKPSTLAKAYGTPLFIVDEPELRGRARSTREAFESEAAAVGTSATVYYASKALLNIEVAKWVTDEGLSIDVASGGELKVALAAGVDPKKIGLHGNNKSLAEIELAVTSGVGTIVIDSEQEIARVAAAAKDAGVRQRVRLRVNSGVHADTHDFLATSHEDQKFGLSRGSAHAVANAIREHDSLDFVGFHCHIGSQIFSAAGFKESAKRLLELYVESPASELNLGGGYGIAYTAEEVASAPKIENMAAEIVQAVADAASELGVPLPHLAFEPGRYIAGPAGVTLYRVGTTKSVELAQAETVAGDAATAKTAEQEFAERVYVSVDGGMSDNIRPALYGAKYEGRLANRVSEKPAMLARLVGKNCESGDIVIDRLLLPEDTKPGDLVMVAATGAYCHSLASNYNYLPRPAMVAVNNGRSRLIVRGQSEEDLVMQSVMGGEIVEHTGDDFCVIS